MSVEKGSVAAQCIYHSLLPEENLFQAPTTLTFLHDVLYIEL